MEWVHRAQDRAQCGGGGAGSFERGNERRGIPRLAERLSVSQEILCSTDLVVIVHAAQKYIQKCGKEAFWNATTRKTKKEMDFAEWF
jgi:hypothetical protein